MPRMTATKKVEARILIGASFRPGQTSAFEREPEVRRRSRQFTAGPSRTEVASYRTAGSSSAASCACSSRPGAGRLMVAKDPLKRAT